MEECSETLVSVDFVPVGDGTDVQILHEDLPSPAVRDDHSEGWNASLIKLQKLLNPDQCAGSQVAVGTFCWNELLTGDLGAATSFYSRLFGWGASDSPIGDIQYKMFTQRASMVGGAMAKTSPQAPTQWLAYIRVEDADASASKASSLGGKVVFGPTDIPSVGRIAVIQDPQGASLGLFTARREQQ